MRKNIFIGLFLAMLLWGCASPPREELQLARQAVAQAHSAGAAELAPTEYHAATAALKDSEDLIHFGNYDLARKVLPFAASHGFRATFKAREERVRLELEKKIQDQKKIEEEEEEEQKRLARIEANKKVKNTALSKNKIKYSKPITPQKLLIHFEVTQKQSLWSISARHEVYNDPLLWPVIYKANRDQIKDPRQVFPGQVLTIPRKLSDAAKDNIRQEALQSESFQTEQTEPPPHQP